MDREKLNKKAEEQAYYSTHWSWGDIKDCFISGANWLMQQPLSERLTEEEKEKIKAIYFRSVYSVADVQSNFTEKCLIDALFGSDLFK